MGSLLSFQLASLFDIVSSTLMIAPVLSNWWVYGKSDPNVNIHLSNPDELSDSNESSDEEHVKGSAATLMTVE